jgi:cell division protein FtsL
MYSLKEKISSPIEVVAQPIVAAKRRRQLYPFFFRMGPVALCMTSVLLIGLMAVLYLSQVGQAVAANQQIQTMQAQQDKLQRQNQDLVNSVSQEQSPGYIADKAKKMGLIPSDPKNVQVITVKNLKPLQKDNQNIQP